MDSVTQATAGSGSDAEEQHEAERQVCSRAPGLRGRPWCPCFNFGDD